VDAVRVAGEPAAASGMPDDVLVKQSTDGVHITRVECLIAATEHGHVWMLCPHLCHCIHLRHCRWTGTDEHGTFGRCPSTAFRGCGPAGHEALSRHCGRI